MDKWIIAVLLVGTHVLSFVYGMCAGPSARFLGQAPKVPKPPPVPRFPITDPKDPYGPVIILKGNNV